MSTALSSYESDIEFYRPESVFLKGSKAPPVSLVPWIGDDGNPNRILERYDLETALEIVTRQHARMAEWVRAQEWGHDLPRGSGKYVNVVKMLKRCRQQLRAMCIEAGLREEGGPWG